jgi:hypothetical protein
VRVLSGEHADSVAQAAGYDAEQRVQSITDLRAFARFSRPRAGLY